MVSATGQVLIACLVGMTFLMAKVAVRMGLRLNDWLRLCLTRCCLHSFFKIVFNYGIFNELVITNYNKKATLPFFSLLHNAMMRR